jgi:hypothetical protein
VSRRLLRLGLAVAAGIAGPVSAAFRSPRDAPIVVLSRPPTPAGGEGSRMHDAGQDPPRRRPLGGIAMSLAAAAAFGVFTPAAKGAATHLGLVRTAGFIYLIAGLVALSALLLRQVAGFRSAGVRLVSRHG